MGKRKPFHSLDFRSATLVWLSSLPPPQTQSETPNQNTALQGRGKEKETNNNNSKKRIKPREQASKEGREKRKRLHAGLHAQLSGAQRLPLRLGLVAAPLLRVLRFPASAVMSFSPVAMSPRIRIEKRKHIPAIPAHPRLVLVRRRWRRRRRSSRLAGARRRRRWPTAAGSAAWGLHAGGAAPCGAASARCCSRAVARGASARCATGVARS